MFFSRYGKLLLAGLFIFLVVEVVLIAPTTIQEGEKEPLIGPVEQDVSTVDQIMEGAHLVGVVDGRQDWELWSKEAVSQKLKDTWSLNEVKALFFGKDGTQFRVTGDKGEVQTARKDMKVEGQVLIRSSNGYTFKTQTMQYSSQDKRLVSPDFVEMIGPRDEDGHAMSLRGTQLKADMTNSLMEIGKDVQAEKTLADGRRVSIRSQRARFSGKSKLAQFIGDVVIDFENMRITGPEAEFQYDSQNKIVESMYVNGGVRVSDQDKWATSQNVKVDFNKDQYTFKGSPRVVQNNDELRGREIIFLNGGKRVKVLGARARVDESRLEN
jgi:LPS export ABC transporter protein LptC